jgi:hypothetical protein
MDIFQRIYETEFKAEFDKRKLTYEHRTTMVTCSWMWWRRGAAYGAGSGGADRTRSEMAEYTGRPGEAGREPEERDEVMAGDACVSAYFGMK